MSYSEAFERQLQLERWWGTANGRKVAEYISRIELASQGVAPSVDDAVDMNRRTLQFADPYYVAPTIVDTLIQAAKVLPSGVVVTRSMIPSAGFAWLAAPLGDSSTGEWGGVRAFSWEESVFKGVGPRAHEPDQPMVTLTFYATFTPTGELGAQSMLNWPIGESWDVDWKPTDPYFVRGEHWGDRPTDAMAFTRAFVLTFFCFIETKIFQTSSSRLERAVRRRLAGKLREEPLVRVVTLRRTAGAPPKDVKGVSHEAVDWSCRWVVSGHWHRYHTREGVQAQWLMPYIKGPENRPLKPPRGRLFAVAR